MHLSSIVTDWVVADDNLIAQHSISSTSITSLNLLPEVGSGGLTNISVRFWTTIVTCPVC